MLHGTRKVFQCFELLIFLKLLRLSVWWQCGFVLSPNVLSFAYAT